MDGTEPRWMTYRELADALGISHRAAEARARRNVRTGRWRHRIDNEPPKAAQVLVPAADLEAMRGGTDGGTRPLTVGDAAGGTDPHNISAMLAELKVSHEQALGEMRRRAEAAEAHAEAAEARTRELAGEAAEQRERAGRVEGERDAARAEAVRLRGDAQAEREKAEAALQRALVAEARLEAGSPPAARAVEAWRAFLGRWKRP